MREGRASRTPPRSWRKHLPAPRQSTAVLVPTSEIMCRWDPTLPDMQASLTNEGLVLLVPGAQPASDFVTTAELLSNAGATRAGCPTFVPAGTGNALSSLTVPLALVDECLPTGTANGGKAFKAFVKRAVVSAHDECREVITADKPLGAEILINTTCVEGTLREGAVVSTNTWVTVDVSCGKCLV